MPFEHLEEFDRDWEAYVSHLNMIRTRLSGTHIVYYPISFVQRVKPGGELALSEQALPSGFYPPDHSYDDSDFLKGLTCSSYLACVGFPLISISIFI